MKPSTKVSTKGLIWKNPAVQGYSKAFRAHYQIVNSNAAVRGIPFELSIPRFHTLVTSNCHYCGCEPESRSFGTMRYEEKLNGVDRLDSNLPYTEANSVPACKICNRVKGVYSIAQYIAHAKRIVNHSKKQRAIKRQTDV